MNKNKRDTCLWVKIFNKSWQDKRNIEGRSERDKWNPLDTRSHCDNLHNINDSLNMSSRSSCNSEAFASELQEDLEEMIPRYYICMVVIEHSHYGYHTKYVDLLQKQLCISSRKKIIREILKRILSNCLWNLEDMFYWYC